VSKKDITLQKFMDILDTHFEMNSIPDAFEIGQVTCLDPLTINVGGLPLYQDNLYINKYLLAWDETVDITTSTVDNHNHTISTIHHPSKLEIGNLVSMYGIEYLQYLYLY
jgi:hypothetical protein